MRSLSKTSNLLRIGDIPPNDSAIPKNGTEVLAETGINQNEAAQAGSFNPGVLNRAQGAAEAVADKVKAGNFDIADIPQAAADIQGLATLVGGIYMPGGDSARDLELCGASPYAMDLMSYAPKYKFLFVMEFEYADAYAEMKSPMQSFVVKSSSRPHVNFEHEEVNMYNFWVKVPKRTSYEPMTFRMYDDQKNAAMTMYENYLKAVSPIANLAFAQYMEATDNVHGAQSMGWDNPPVPPGRVSTSDGASIATQQYAASFGPLGGSIDGISSTVNVFRRITMYQVYNHGASVNIYKFFNPKILSMELDDMDMAESGSGNEVSMQFAYDAVHITTGVSLGERKEIADKVKTLSNIDKYSIDPIFKGDIEALTKTDPNKPGGDPDEGGGGAGVGDFTIDYDLTNGGSTSTLSLADSELGQSITSGASAVAGSVKEFSSNAFTSVTKFAGSIFTTGSGSGDANTIVGSVESDI